MEETTFLVKEAETKDVGRALARLHPEDMEGIGVCVGDIIKVTGEKETAAKVMPAPLQSREQSTVQIDGITRKNAGTSLGEKVGIERVESKGAERVVLEPIGKTLLSQRDSLLVGRLLESMPVCLGDRVRITPFANQYQEFEVANLMPEGPCLVTLGTKVVLREPSGVGTRSITYEDIGGLKQELQRVREMIELPLKHPEVFGRLGIEAPKGVLLFGPPGCGKTLIARAVANEVDANFFATSGPEIFHKFYGESEAHLRSIFQQAQQSAPAIIFLDEIEAISSKREEVRGDQQVERRVTSQLLALMDGLKERGQIIVIAATNAPDLIDPALRRPGRFDREIEISVPDRDGRLEILEIHTRAMPLWQDVGLENIANRTHGFVGADLAALSREAAMSALRRVLPDIDLAQGVIPPEKLESLYVTPRDFQEALKEVNPSALREVYFERPDVSWQDVGGLEDVKRALEEAVEWPLKHGDLFDHTATPPPVGILLSGPPGCGKTLIARALAHETEVNFISIKGPALMSKWVGETEKGVREVFRKARAHGPCIVFIDEIDSIAPRRGQDVSMVTDRALSQLLTEIDGMEPLEGVVVLAATNRIDLIDEALLRPGRFDVQLEFPMPDEEARWKIFQVHTRRKPLVPDVSLDELAHLTEGCFGADIAGICQRASMIAIREFLEKGLEDKAQCQITRTHFEMAMRVMSIGTAVPTA